MTKTKFQLLIEEHPKLFTMQRIAHIAGVTPQMVLKYARGVEPGVTKASKIADLFGVSIKWLWCESGGIDDYEEEKQRYKAEQARRMPELQRL
jgi:transcriptional regulator with XRE-family HTH domain